MEKSKLASILIAKLKLSYPSYFKNMTKEELIQLISTYQEMLGEYNEQVLNEVAKKIIKTKKYMPTIAEIIEICEDEKKNVRNVIIEKMIANGYFKSEKEIEKVYLWIEQNIIPKWLQEDMKKYYTIMISNKEKLQIEGI